jgi:hypothetical protein
MPRRRRAEGFSTVSEQDYLETLTLLIEDFDEQHFTMETARFSPLDMLHLL